MCYQINLIWIQTFKLLGSCSWNIFVLGYLYFNELKISILFQKVFWIEWSLCCSNNVIYLKFPITKFLSKWEMAFINKSIKIFPVNSLVFIPCENFLCIISKHVSKYLHLSWNTFFYLIKIATICCVHCILQGLYTLLK